MNDFGIDLTGKQGVLKDRNFHKKGASASERTFTITGGPGCNPDPAWSRRVEVRTAPGVHENISSYDFEYVLVDGKKIKPIDTGAPLGDIALVCATATPAPPTPAQQKPVRRKR